MVSRRHMHGYFSVSPVWQILKMSGEGVWSHPTFCPTRESKGQCLPNRCPVISLISAGHFTVKCPARIKNGWWKTGGGSNEFHILCLPLGFVKPSEYRTTLCTIDLCCAPPTSVMHHDLCPWDVGVAPDIFFNGSQGTCKKQTLFVCVYVAEAPK